MLGTKESGMLGRRINLLSALIATLMAGAVAAGLWLNYQKECQGQARVSIVRARTILTSLESSLRSHRHMGGRFEQNVQVLVEEAAKNPGSIGLGIYDRAGRVLAHGGALPAQPELQEKPVWRSDGLWLAQQFLIAQPGDDQGFGPGPGWGRGPQISDAVRATYREPIWLAVLLDTAEYHQALIKERWQFALSLLAALAMLALGLGMIVLMQHQGRLRAELGLAAEREQRLEELARLGAGLAHETKNPLSLIRGLAQHWLARPESENGLRQEAQQIVDEADRVVGRINSFLEYSRQPEPDFQSIKLGAMLGDMVQLFQDEAKSRHVDIRLNAPPVCVMADPGMVRQVVVNLLANTLAFCRPGDRVELALAPDPAGNGANMALCIRDTGPGIAPEDLPQVTQPYFTRRPGGTGLGLAIVKQIAEAHGWQLEIQSAPGQGTAVRISGLRRERSRQS